MMYLKAHWPGLLALSSLAFCCYHLKLICQKIKRQQKGNFLSLFLFDIARHNLYVCPGPGRQTNNIKFISGSLAAEKCVFTFVEPAATTTTASQLLCRLSNITKN